MRIRFTRDDVVNGVYNADTIIEVDGNATWWEVTNRFIQFLQGTGYQVNVYEIGEYITEEYGFQKDG